MTNALARTLDRIDDMEIVLLHQLNVLRDERLAVVERLQALKGQNHEETNQAGDRSC